MEMKKLMQNRKKGFTLVELIVVIVIIAILIAALTPAILGVIERANVAADQADARVILLEAQTAAIRQDGTISQDDATARADVIAGQLGLTIVGNLRFDAAGMPSGVTVSGGRSTAGATAGTPAPVVP
jgi:type IV pilus assembly protein PilA